MVYDIQVCWQLVSRSICSCSQAVSKPVWHIPLLCVQWKTSGDGQWNCPKHIDLHSKNKFEKLVYLVGFIIRNLSRCMVTWTSNSIIIFTLDNTHKSLQHTPQQQNKFLILRKHIKKNLWIKHDFSANYIKNISRKHKDWRILHELLNTLTPATGTLRVPAGEYTVSPHLEHSQNLQNK